MATDVENTSRPRKRKRRLRRIAIGLAALCALALILAPTIAGPVAGPIVERAVNDQIRGRATVVSISLGWFGPQRVELTLDDPDGARVADLSVRAEKSLLGLAVGSRQLGLVHVEGDADIRRAKDGTTNLQRAIEPRFVSGDDAGPDDGAAASLPAGLSASVVLDGVRVTFSDAALLEATGGQIGAVRAGELRGSLDLAVGATSTLNLRSPLLTGPSSQDLVASGSVDIRIGLDGLTDAEGGLTPDAVRADASLTLSAPVVDAVFAGGYAGGVLTRTGESRIVLDAQELSMLVPQLGAALVGQPGVEITSLPELSVSIAELAVPIGGDLRDAAAQIEVLSTETLGSVALAGDGAPSPFRFEPLELSIGVPSLAESVTVTGGTSATIGGESAGELGIDISASGLLDDAGALRTGMPASVAGGLRVEGFATAIVQPYMSAVNTMLPAGARIELPRDFGSTLSMVLDARTIGAEPDAYDVDLTLDAERAEVRGALSVRGQRIVAREDGLQARFESLAPIADNLLSTLGVRVDRGVGVTIDAPVFDVDLARLGGPDGPDLRGVAVDATVGVEGTAGTVQLEGYERPYAFEVARVAVGVRSDDLAGDLRVTADTSLSIDGSPLGAARAEFTLGELLGDGGGPRTDALPSFRGEARVDNIQHGTLDQLLRPMLEGVGIELATDLGPRGDLLLVGASAGDAGPDASGIDLTFRSSKLDVTAPLIVTPDRVTSRQPITLVGRAAGATAARLLPGSVPATLRPAGVARVSIANLDVPIVDGFVPRPDSVRASLSVTLTEFAADVDELVDARGAMMPSQRVAVERLVLSANASPGAAPTLSLDADLTHDGEAFGADMSATLHGLFLDEPADASDPMSVLAVGSVRPESRLTLRDVPASLARLVPADAVVVGESSLDFVLLTRDLMGRTFDVAVTTAPSPHIATVTQLGVDVRGQGITGQVRGRFDDRHARLFSASGSAGVTPRLARHLIGVFATDLPVRPGLRSPARLEFELLEEVEIPFADGFKPDAERAEGRLTSRVKLNAPLAAITLPAEEGAEPIVVPAVTLRDMTVDLGGAVGALLGGSGGVDAAIAGRILREDDSVLTTLRGGGEVTLESGAPTGAIPVSLALDRLDARWIDEILGRPAMVAGAIGDRVSLTVEADPDRLMRRDGREAAVRIGVDAPRFKTMAPVALSLNREALFIKEPIEAEWTIGPAWGNHYLFGRRPDAPAPALEFTSPTLARIEVPRLAIAAGEGAGPLKPGVFIANLTATLPDASARMRDGTVVRLRRVEARMGRGPTPTQIGFSLSLPSMQIGDADEFQPRKSQISGTLASFTDADGNPTPETAEVTLNGGIEPIPTALVDALAQQNGLIVDAAGDTANFAISAQQLSLEGGTMLATLTTPLLSAEARGEVIDGMLILEQGVLAEVSVITPELADRFQKALPVVASLEKTRDDEPAQIILTSPVAVPLDGNFDKLNGMLTVDIGTARFGTADLFERVLSIAHQKTAGEVGNRLPPLHVTIVDGLVSYEPFALPFGEFTLETQGFINLGSRPRTIREAGGAQLPSGELEVLTFIPAGAFVAEALPGGIAPGISRLPIRTKGQIASPRNNIALDLVGQNAINNLLDPGKLLEDGGLLKDLLDRGR